MLVKHSLVAALSDMVAVKPRRQIIYPIDRLGANAPSDRILQVHEQFALNHVNRKLVLEPKVNTRFVHFKSLALYVCITNNFCLCIIEVNHCFETLC